MIINQETGGNRQETAGTSRGAVIATVVMLAVIAALLVWRFWPTPNPYLPPAGAIEARHVMLEWREGFPAKEKRDEIRELERQGYRFKGSYEVKGWTHLVYEKD